MQEYNIGAIGLFVTHKAKEASRRELLIAKLSKALDVSFQEATSFAKASPYTLEATYRMVCAGSFTKIDSHVNCRCMIIPSDPNVIEALWEVVPEMLQLPGHKMRWEKPELRALGDPATFI